MKYKNTFKISSLIFTLMFFPAMANAQMDMDMDMSKDMKHGHTPVSLPKESLTPQLTISLTPDSMSGYNLHLDVSQFQLESPVNMGKSPQNIVEGHAHLYINGKKIQRVYGNDVHIPGKHFKKGMNQINVTLNNHDHNAWQKDGKEIISSVFINTEKETLVSHQFSSFPVLVKN
ncbi:MAG: hypothetical protein V7785_19990 [Bermanella sp.]